eukprot:2519085-Prymnesium_polylepis.1
MQAQHTSIGLNLERLVVFQNDARDVGLQLEDAERRLVCRLPPLDAIAEEDDPPGFVGAEAGPTHGVLDEPALLERRPRIDDDLLRLLCHDHGLAERLDVVDRRRRRQRLCVVLRRLCELHGRRRLCKLHGMRRLCKLHRACSGCWTTTSLCSRLGGLADEGAHSPWSTCLPRNPA